MILGIQVDELEITSIGVKYGPFMDRTFVILNENNLLVSQRIKPKLALIQTSLCGTKIILSAKGKKTIWVDVNQNLSNNEKVEFELWKQPTAGVVCGEEINKWLSDFLDLPVRLVRFIDETHPYRASFVEIDGNVVNDESLPIRYQDGDPIFLTNSASITDLNNRMARDARVSYLNFRPNIHVQLDKPYAEDKIKMWTIGNLKFKNIKPCDRCTFTTVNPQTGVKHPDLEPLKTLKTYRLWGNYTSPLFGVNLTPITLGKVKLGDYVQADELQ